jgi:hypothetical protein
MNKHTLRNVLYAFSLLIVLGLIFCLEPTNPDDPDSDKYEPTDVTLSLFNVADDGKDTIRANITTETPVTIDFEAVHISRIDTILVDINSASGADKKIVVVMNDLKTKWIDNSKYSLPAFKYDEAGIYEITVTISLKNGQADIIKKFFVEVTYVPTEISLFMANKEVKSGDTIRYNYKTETPIAIDFMAAHINRIDTILIDADVSSGVDQQLVVLMDTMATKWVDSTKYALPAFQYKNGGIYEVNVTTGMNNNQSSISKTFFIEVLYDSTTATFLLGDAVLGLVDTIKNGYTTETALQLDFSGRFVKRIQSVTVDIDANKGDDENIVINTDTLTSSWADSVRYKIAHWKYSKAGKYQLAVTAKMRNSQKDIVASSWIQIAGMAPSVTLQPVNKNVNEGDSVSFQTNVAGSQPLSYSWYRFKGVNNGVDILEQLNGKLSSQLHFDLVMLEDSGSYVCVIKNDFGSVTTAKATLGVKALPPDINSPVVSFAVDTGSGIEGNGGAVKVKLSKKYTSEVSVSVSTLPTTTAAIEDFTITTPVIRFGVNETEKTFAFTTTGNVKPEPDRKIVFYLKAASRANIDTTKNKYTYIIYDDDTDRDSTWPKVEFEKSTGEGLERDVAGIRLMLSKDTTYEIKVKLKLLSSSSTDASDFVLSDSIITFSPNEKMKLLTLNVKNDKVRENDESVLLQLEKYNDSSKVTIGTKNIFTYTIHDDDTSIVYFGKESDGCVEGDTTVKIPVLLSSKNTNPVTVQFTIASPEAFANALGGGKDYTLAGNNSLSISPLADTGWIELKIHEDTIAEEDEIITLILSNVSGGSVLPAIPDTFFYKIRDDENSSVGFETPQTDVMENIGDTAVVHVWMSLTGPVQDSVYVQYNVSGGDALGTDADYEVIGSVPQKVLIRPGETRADIKIKIIDDKRDEKTEYFDLQITGVTGGNTKIGSMNIHKIRIIDDDIPYFYFDTLLSSVSENAGKVLIPVRLSTPSVYEIRVRFAVAGGTATDNGTDYRMSASDTVTFDAEDTVEYIEANIIQDALDEDNETIVLNLIQLDTTALPKAGQVQHTITIIDQNSATGVGFSSTQLLLPEEGTAVNIPVSFAAATGKTASVQFQIKGETANWNGGDVVVAGHTSGIGTLNFAIGDITKNITVTPVNDLLDDDNESFTITLFNPDNCVLLKDSIITISIVDNDYKVTVQSSGNGTVTPNGDTIVSRGSNFQIRARAAANYHFVGWTPSTGLAVAGLYDTLTNMSNVTANGTVTAAFSINSGTVTLAAGEHGKAYVGTIYSGDIVRTYGAVLSFDNVVADPNYHFKEWLVSNPANIVLASGTMQSSDATFTIRGNGTITPVFAINTYKITVGSNNVAMGTTTPSGEQTVDYNGFIGLVASNVLHYHFMRWEATGDVSNANLKNRLLATTSLDSIKGNGTVTAYFGIDSNTVTFVSENETQGTVGFASYVFPYGDSVAINATPNTGYHFGKWEITAGTGNFTIVNSALASTKIKNVTGPGSITAKFLIDTFVVSITGSHGAVSPSGAQNVIYNGGIATIQAGTPETGYEFKDWSLANTAKATINPNVTSSAISLSNVTASNTLTANFVLKTYTLNVTPNDPDGIASTTLTPLPTAGKYNHGTTVKIKITRASGWRVSSWSANVAPIGGATSDSANITMTADTNVTVTVVPLPVPGNVICVKSDAPGTYSGNNGTSWVDAYKDLTSALAELGTNTAKNTIWVARGTYNPVNSSSSFNIPQSNVSIIGGFAGTENLATQRDSINNTTVLDGLVNSTNVAAVVTVPSGSDNVFLTTFTIKNAVGGTTLTVPHGGIYAYNSNRLTIQRCVITNNYPCGVECGVSTIVKQSAIVNNTGVFGAGLSVQVDTLFLMHSVVAGNNADNNGGGLYVTGSGKAIIINSDIVYNSSTSASTGKTGGISIPIANAIYMANSILWGNTTVGGGTAGTQISFCDTVYRCNIQDTARGTGIGRKTVEDGWAGTVVVNPNFRSSTVFAGADNLWFTSDDGLVLQSGSSNIDAGRSIISHPSWWSEAVDIRGVSIVTGGTKNYDIGAYDQ